MNSLADLEPNKKPKLALAAEVTADPTLTDFQKRVLHELLFFANQHASADRLAHYLGYRPAMRGRLAVSSALRALLDPARENGAVGKYIVRVAPRDQWDSAAWCLRKEWVTRVDCQGNLCREEADPITHKKVWVITSPTIQEAPGLVIKKSAPRSRPV